MNKQIVPETQFSYVYELIEQAKSDTWRQINKNLVSLYWNIGEYILKQTITDGWGKGTVQQLSNYILSRNHSAKGFSARNLWRMKQFHETYVIADLPRICGKTQEW